MTIWDTARKLLSRSVVGHLGESLVFTTDDATATARGILTRPEQVIRLGLAHVTADHATLAMRRSDAPEWIARGVTVLTLTDEVFEVTEIADNGEIMLEIVLCRSS